MHQILLPCQIISVFVISLILTLIFNFVAVFTVSAVLSEMFGECVGSRVASASVPIIPIVLPSSFNNLPDVVDVLFGPRIQVVLGLPNIRFVA